MAPPGETRSFTKTVQAKMKERRQTSASAPLAPMPKERKSDGQPCRMEWPDDIENPHNCPLSRKRLITAFCQFDDNVVRFSSSIFSTTVEAMPRRNTMSPRGDNSWELAVTVPDRRTSNSLCTLPKERHPDDRLSGVQPARSLARNAYCTEYSVRGFALGPLIIWV